MSLDIQFMLKTFLEALKGIPVTIGITLVALVLAAPVSWLMAIVRLRSIPFLSGAARLYTSLIRGTPIILQILLIYSLLPGILNNLIRQAGISYNIFDLNPIYYAFVVFALNSSAGLSEIIRSALLTVPRGQLEAAHAAGLSSRQAYTRIIIPQALVNALPNLCNLTVNLIKASSLAFIMTAKDITAIARIEASFGYNYIEAYIVIFLMYIILCSLTQVLFNIAEKRAGRYRAAASTRTSRLSISGLFITTQSEVRLNA